MQQTKSKQLQTQENIVKYTWQVSMAEKQLLSSEGLLMMLRSLERIMQLNEPILHFPSAKVFN